MLCVMENAHYASSSAYYLWDKGHRQHQAVSMLLRVCGMMAKPKHYTIMKENLSFTLKVLTFGFILPAERQF